MNKNNSKCPTCSGNGVHKKGTKWKNLKKVSPKPYGVIGTNPYCNKCDIDSTYKISKKSERNKAKKQIKRDLDEN